MATSVTETQIIALAREHSADIDDVRWCATQVQAVFIDELAALSNEDLNQVLTRERLNGASKRDGALTLFIHAAAKQRLNAYQVTDLLVALVCGNKQPQS